MGTSSNDSDETLDTTKNNLDWTGLMMPLTLEHIDQAIRHQIRSAGPDNVSLTKLKNTSRDKLLVLFNLMLATSKCPDCFKESRTILLPKTDSHQHRLNIPQNIPPYSTETYRHIASAR